MWRAVFLSVVLAVSGCEREVDIGTPPDAGGAGGVDAAGGCQSDQACGACERCAAGSCVEDPTRLNACGGCGALEEMCGDGVDNDCNDQIDEGCASCGDGERDPGETCDGDCPSSCDDAVACTADAMTGSAGRCTAACTHTAITACRGGDGCCPAGCNTLNDADCNAVCGNRVVEPGEECDGNCPPSCADTNPCTVDGSTGSAANCNLTCTHTPAPGTGCDDRDACTESDQCDAQGACRGTPKVCGAAPAPTCVSATTLRTYQGAGTCSAGSCTWSHQDSTCAQQCDAAAGACGCGAGLALCGGSCVAESPAGCGQTCEVCPPAPTNGYPVCQAGTCDFACKAGYFRCGNGCCPWIIEQVAPGLAEHHSNGGLSLAIDSQDRLHLAYHVTTIIPNYSYSEQIIHSTRDSNGWTSSGGVTAVRDGTREQYLGSPSIAVDSADRWWVAYSETTYTGSYSSSASVNVVTVAPFSATRVTPLNGGGSPSLAIDPSGNPRLSLGNCTKSGTSCVDRLDYAEFDGTTWKLEELDSAWGSHDAHVLVVDPAGVSRVAYYRPWEIDLRTKGGGIWSAEKISSCRAAEPVYDVAFALDDVLRPHVAWRDPDLDVLRYAVKSQGTWSVETVDAGEGVGHAVALAIGPSRETALCYCDNPNKQIKCAQRQAGGWSMSVVATWTGASECSSREIAMKIDSLGKPHLVYYEQDTGALMLAQ